ncbi:MAG: hypothetical protein ACJ764_03040 [Solirubrobacteraceae bacterium]
MEEQRSPAGNRRSVSRRRREVLLTPRDQTVLEMAAEHRVILPSHAAALLGVTPPTAGARLRELVGAGYLARHRIFAGQPACFQITRRGLDVIGSGLPRPRVDLRALDHDVGLAWVWLAARDGAFGAMSEVLSERTLRSRDGKRLGIGASGADPEPSGGSGPLGIRLGGTDPHGRARLHYPDLLLITPEGRRVAVELEFSSKGQARLDRILAGYGSDARTDAVLYLVDRPALAQTIRSRARRLGLSSLVHVQWVRQPVTRPTGTIRAAERSPAARER